MGRYAQPNGESLGNLQCVTEGDYLLANAGLVHTFQLIDVPGRFFIA